MAGGIGRALCPALPLLPFESEQPREIRLHKILACIFAAVEDRRAGTSDSAGIRNHFGERRTQDSRVHAPEESRAERAVLKPCSGKHYEQTSEGLNAHAEENEGSDHEPFKGRLCSFDQRTRAPFEVKLHVCGSAASSGTQTQGLHKLAHEFGANYTGA